MNYILSEHVLTRAEERSIPQTIIDQVLSNPDQIVDDESGETGQKVYQAIIDFETGKRYLVRVFVNTVREPNVVKTVYRTSKISRYV